MTNHTARTGLAGIRCRHAERGRSRAARRALAADLAGYTSPADLIELSAVLARHADADADTVRELVDWTRAA